MWRRWNSSVACRWPPAPTEKSGETWQAPKFIVFIKFIGATRSKSNSSVPVPYGDAGDRYWRITVVNGNDAPLADASVRLYTTPRHLVFEQQPGKTIR